MEYITVQQAAERWGVTVRRVQNLCGKSRIPGAIRFNRSWAIPKDAEKPRDDRYKVNEERQNNLVQSFQSICGNAEVFSKIVEFFPYPIQISTLDGTLILANEAFLKNFHIESKDKVIGKYNVFQDPAIEKLGIKEHVLRAFQGGAIQLHDIKVPIQDIINKYGKRELNLETIFQNITSFPIYNENNQLLYVVTVFMTSRLYRGREEIIKGKEYIESHRQEEFNIDATAKASGLSKVQFTRLFKTYTGYTPHDYYVNIKINMIKEKLLDFNLSISQAFLECGVDYNGHYAKIFKDLIGITPSEYRKNNIKI